MISVTMTYHGGLRENPAEFVLHALKVLNLLGGVVFLVLHFVNNKHRTKTQLNALAVQN